MENLAILRLSQEDSVSLADFVMHSSLLFSLMLQFRSPRHWLRTHPYMFNTEVHGVLEPFLSMETFVTHEWSSHWLSGDIV